MLIENPAFIGNYTGFKNLKVLASIQNRVDDEHIREVIHQVGLDPDDKRTYRKYSLGMKQKLGIACLLYTSTQFLSALMMTSPMIEEGIHVHITSNKTEGSYVRITAKMMEQFGCVVDHKGAEYVVPAGSGYYPQTYYIEPDVSAACYFYAAAALTGGTAIVKGVHSNSMQGDLKFIDVLRCV